MASYTTQIPVIKSSNNDEFIVGSQTGGINVVRLPRISEYLYLGTAHCAVAVDEGLIPKNKRIVEAKLHIYANGSIGNEVNIYYSNFSEGGLIQPKNHARSFPGVNQGWNSFTLPLPLNNSIIFTAHFEPPPLAVWYYISMNSHRNANNKPYIEIVYTDMPPDKPTSLFPANTTVNPRDVIKFSWSHNSNEKLQQEGFTLQYSTNNGSTWTTVTETTANQFYEMPADTLPNSGSLLWRVKTIDGNNEESEYENASFTLGLVPQKAPVLLAPLSQYLDQSKIIRLEWVFVGGGSSEVQSKVDIDYSTNGGYSWTTKTIETGNHYYNMEANTLDQGNVTWRIRTYNNWDEVSPYSETGNFTVIGSPPIPLIDNVSNTGSPVISWQSINQHIYELQILKDNRIIFDSGSIPSPSDREFKLPIYLKDGNYKARLRIYNEYNLFSQWAEKNFTISTVKPLKPIIEVYASEYSVSIKGDVKAPTNLIYRENMCIGRLENNIFVDFTGENGKEYEYFIRSIDNEDNFNDSDVKVSKCKFTGNTLALAEVPGDFLKLKYGLDSIPRKRNNFSVDGTLNYYDGREYPVTEYSSFKSKSKTVSFALKKKEELSKLINLISAREVLLFRDVDGENIYGNVLELDYEKNILGFYEIDFTITKTSYEGVCHD